MTLFLIQMAIASRRSSLTFTVDPIPQRELVRKFEQLWASGKDGALGRPEVELVMPGLFRFAKPVDDEARYSRMFEQAWELAAQPLDDPAKPVNPCP